MNSEFDRFDYRLPKLAALLVVKDYEAAKEILSVLREENMAQSLISETILQTYLFDGYPTALEGLFLMAEVFSDDFIAGNEETIDAETIGRWFDKGIETCRKIYAGNYERLVKNLSALSPDLANWMILEGYGKVLSRSELSLEYRELINIAILAIKYYPRQLHSHIKGALNIGVTKNEILYVLRQLILLNEKNILKAEELLDSITIR